MNTSWYGWPGWTPTVIADPKSPRLMWRQVGKGVCGRRFLTLVNPGEEQPGDVQYEGIQQ